MRALMMTAPSQGSDRTQVREIGEPRPGPGGITIDVAYAGINFIDVMARRGDPGYAGAWPYVPGLEATGTIRELGAGVSGLTVGQRVAAFTPGGGLAEVALARAALAVPVPEQVSLLTAAGAPMMFATALLLLTDAVRLGSGECAGAFGQRRRGQRHRAVGAGAGRGLRLGTVGRPDKVAAARQSGYDLAFARDDDVIEAVRAATGGSGVDVVLDPLGTSMLDVDLAVTAPGGRIVLFGNAGGGQPAPLPPVGKLIGGNIAIGGFSISSLSVSAPERVAAALRRVLDLIAAGRLDVAVTEIDSLADVPAVHQLLADRRGNGKYVTRLTTESDTP